MKLNKTLLYIATIYVSTLASYAQHVGANTRNDPGAAELIAQEQSLIASAHNAAMRGDDAACVAELTRPADVRLDIADSLATLRRTATVCALLANENEYPVAKRIARLGIAHVQSAREFSPEQRTEHLYWEAWLQLDVLDSPAAALATIRIAETLAPSEERFLTLRKRAEAASNPHGR